MMSEYNGANAWDDAGNVKVEEDEMESESIDLTQNISDLNDIEFVKIEEQESECVALSSPYNLSLARRSVGVQTEDSMQEVFSSSFPHLSVKQIHTILDLMATILVKTKQIQPATKQISENIYKTMTEVNQMNK